MQRKRKTLAERKAEILAKQQTLAAETAAKEKKLKEQLAQLAARERKLSRKDDTHLKVLFGAGTMAHARLDKEWRRRLDEVMTVSITNARDLAKVRAWLDSLD